MDLTGCMMEITFPTVMTRSCDDDIMMPEELAKEGQQLGHHQSQPIGIG